MFREKDKVTINTPMETEFHGRTGIVTNVQAGFNHVKVDGMPDSPYRFSDRELTLSPTDWSNVLDGLDVDELRSLASAALEKAFWLLTDATERD